MKKITISLLTLIIVSGATYYFVFKDLPREDSETSTYDYSSNTESNMSANPQSGENQSTETPVNQPVQIEPTTQEISVNIKNFSYSPATLNVKVGTKVTWANSDSAPHTVTSDSGGLLNSNALSSGQSFSFTFTKVGTENYHCALHPMMKGSVVVTN